MRGALFNRKPGWSGTGENERKDKEENKNGKAKQRPFKVHFSPFELTCIIIHGKYEKINQRIYFGWTFLLVIEKV
jgi:hypothetical protein